MGTLTEQVDAALRSAGEPAGLRGRMLAGDELAWVELAERRTADGDGDGAVSVLSALVEQAPGSAEGWAALARIFESAGLADDALGCWQQAVAAQGRADHLVAMGTLLQRHEQNGPAAGCYVRALRVDPDSVVAHHNLAALYVASGRLEGAAQHYREVVSRDPSHVRAWGNLGVVLRRMERNDEAITALEQAVLRDSGYAPAWANLASAFEAANRIEDAREAVSRALKLAPADALTLLTAARLARRAGALDEAAERLAAIAGELPDDLAARVHLERGFVQDRRGDAAGAWAAFSAGQAGLAALPEARAVRRAVYPDLVDRVAASADALWARSAPEDPEPPPVFVVGFPRSGTTLTEQIIAGHPAFATSDEAPLLERALGRVAVDVGHVYPQGLAEADDASIQGLRAAYRESMPSVDGRFVDKFPLNLVHLPAIRLLFPTAPIVVVLRDPRDVVLSGFMQDFVPNEAMVHLDTTANAAALYARVMQRWLDWRERAGAVHVVRYEDIVTDLEGQARALIGYLGEPWDPTVLQYHRAAAERHISTPSHQDVATPIFRRAAGRWRRYAEQLAPVQGVLAPFVDAFGYDP